LVLGLPQARSGDPAPIGRARYGSGIVIVHGDATGVDESFGVPGTPYLTAWANSGKSGRERALRLMAIRQARLEPLALSVSGRERMSVDSS